MSGAPVVELSSGDVIGMLRTTRQLGSNLGGWVVPADLIRTTWPDEIGLANNRFHQGDSRWRDAASQLRVCPPSKEGTQAGSGLSIGSVEGDVISMITGGTIGTVNIEYGPAKGHRRE
jgi:hypothetical protein